MLFASKMMSIQRTVLEKQKDSVNDVRYCKART